MNLGQSHNQTHETYHTFTVIIPNSKLKVSHIYPSLSSGTNINVAAILGEAAQPCEQSQWSELYEAYSTKCYKLMFHLHIHTHTDIFRKQIGTNKMSPEFHVIGTYQRGDMPHFLFGINSARSCYLISK